MRHIWTKTEMESFMRSSNEVFHYEKCEHEGIDRRYPTCKIVLGWNVWNLPGHFSLESGEVLRIILGQIIHRSSQVFRETNHLASWTKKLKFLVLLAEWTVTMRILQA